MATEYEGAAFVIPALAVSVIVLLGSPAGAPAGEPHWVDQLGLAQAWSHSRGEGVRVGLVDTGVDLSEPALTGQVLVEADFPDLGGGATSGESHGTIMASLVAEVAPQAKILSARMTGGPEDANNAIRWAVDYGATVINVSLGGPVDSPAFDAGLRYAMEHDAVVVAAAGNADVDSEVTSPADRPGVVAVSAVDENGHFARNVSVSGHEVSFAAPGVGITTASKRAAPTSGTSHAAALMTGVVALVRARFPQLTAEQVVERLARTAKDMGAPGRDPEYGYGTVDPVAALLSPAATETESSALTWWLGPLGLLVIVGVWLLIRGRTRVFSWHR
ncbi:S8 family serine peptidase [Amycolatopsis japonica]|uniref:S8 family serine peptidase n=1 Tax=Amycolatopsis japonica TaxID=208439 RepID=UPI00366E0BD2